MVGDVQNFRWGHSLMATSIVVYGDPSSATLRGLSSPFSGVEWHLSWVLPDDEPDPGEAGLVVLDATALPAKSRVFADLPSRFEGVPCLVVSDGPFDLGGLEAIDAARCPDLSAEVGSRLERLGVDCKVRWLCGLGGDPFVGQILQIVLATVPVSVAGISDAVAAGELHTAATIAHRTKANAAYVGALTVYETAHRIEVDARGGTTDSLQAVSAALTAAWERVAPMLVAHRDEAAKRVAENQPLTCTASA
jgi:HPt (histidine-containing phosphotransfer) domain-containing protein